VAFGADTFDSASYALFARELRYMTRCGVRNVGELEELPCSCPICSRRTPRELLEMPREEAVGLIARHNLYVLREELLDVRQALHEGRLWEYLMQKTTCHPSLYGVRSLMVEASGDFAEFTRLFKRRALLLFGHEDVHRPELMTAASRVRRVPPHGKSITLLIVHSVEVQAAPSVGDDVYFVVPFLGVVPPGLSDVYPFSQNSKPDPASFDDRVLEETARASADVVSGWGVTYAKIVHDGSGWAAEMAGLLASRLMERGISTIVEVSHV
ncbi:MAG: tRNA-guanine transglycosylase, partial [Conexivisphaera sp.]